MLTPRQVEDITEEPVRLTDGEEEYVVELHDWTA
jgi:hypothetical protein